MSQGSEGDVAEITDIASAQLAPILDERPDDWEQLVRLVTNRLITSRMLSMHHVSDLLQPMITVQGVGLDNARLRALLLLAQNSALRNDVHIMYCTGCFLVAEANADQVEDGARFYIRSMHFTRDQLQAVLEVYEQQYADPQLCQNYLEMLANSPQVNDFYIRYAGCTEASNPLERHRSDLEALPQTRIGNFLTAMQQANVEPAFQVFEVPSLFVPAAQGGGINQELVDASEQLLIHLFGRQFLLNSQPGGFYRAYLPQQQDLVTSGLTEDQVLRELFFGEHQQVQVNQDILQLYQAWYQDHLQNVDPLQAAQLEDAHINLFAQQASAGATTVENLQPLMIFAKDITIEDAALLRGFFDGSRAGQLTKDLISSALGAFNDRDNFIPPAFHDLWPVKPFPRSQQQQWQPFLNASAEIIQHISPLVLVTMGFDPAAASFSNFRHSYSMGTAEYLEHIGVPFICHTDLEFDYEGADEDAVPNHQVITIAHYHPGFVSYGSGDPIILRFMLLTWCRTFALVRCCIQELQGEGLEPPVPREQRPNPGTLEFCNNVLERLNQRENDNGFAVLFNQAKTAVQESLHEQRQNAYAASVRRAELRADPMPNVALANYIRQTGGTLAAKTERFGYAAGEPNSPERLVQCRVLERHKYPELRRLPSFGHHTRHPNAASEWRQFFLGLVEGTNIAQAVIARAGWENVEPLQGLTREQSRFVLTQCRAPDGWEGEGQEWQYDRDLALAAISQYMSWMVTHRNRQRDEHGHIIIQDATREQFRLASVSPGSEIVPVEFFHMARVNVNGGKIKFSVFMGPGRTNQRSIGELFVGRMYAGVKCLDYDTTITTHGLVLKEQDGTLSVPPKILQDWFILYYNRDRMFVVFERTVRNSGQTLRLPIVEELALPPDQQFQFARLLRIFLQQRHDTHDGQAFQLRTGPAIVPHPPARGRGRGRGRPYGRARGRGAGRGAGAPVETAAEIAARVPRFVDLFRAVMDEQELRGIEEYMWDYHLDNDLNKISREIRQLAQVNGTFIQYTDPNDTRGRPMFSLWTITYPPP